MISTAQPEQLEQPATEAAVETQSQPLTIGEWAGRPPTPTIEDQPSIDWCAWIIVVPLLVYCGAISGNIGAAWIDGAKDAAETCVGGCDFSLSPRWTTEVTRTFYGDEAPARIEFGRFLLSTRAEHRALMNQWAQEFRDAVLIEMRKCWLRDTPLDAAAIEAKWNERWDRRSRPELSQYWEMNKCSCSRGYYLHCKGRGGGHSIRHQSLEIRFPDEDWSPKHKNHLYDEVIWYQ